MNIISGKWYPKDSATQYAAELIVDKDSYKVHITPSDLNPELSSNSDSQGHILTGQWSQIKINDRLGNTERKLILADGSLFTTHENDDIDTLIQSNKSSGSESKLSLLLHRHETKMSSVLVMLVLTIAFVFGFIKWGIPWTSQAVAHALPQQTGDFIGKQSLDFIDSYFLEPTTISEAKQQQIIDRFNTRLKPVGGDDRIHYQLHFREMNVNGVSLPNAFALPSGDIVLTDEFVKLSENDDEIDAVLLHEMGHVVERHSLEMLTQNSLTTMIVILVLGNPDGISELATGLGTALVSNHYSRQYETEADKFAFNKMLKIGINPQSFVDILSRMEDYATAEITADNEHESTQEQQTQDVEEDKISDFLSTHPNTQLRIKMAEKYSQCFEQGLQICE